MEKKDKSFAKKFINIIIENLDSSKFSIEKNDDRTNNIYVANKEKDSLRKGFFIFECDSPSTKTTNDNRVGVVHNYKTCFFDANNIKEKNIIDKIDELGLDDHVPGIKDLFRKAIDKYNISNNTNIADECFVVKNEQQKDSPSKKFIDILSKYTSITEKLGKAEATKDPKSEKNKIFLNDKWYDRAHWTETSVVKSKINKVFDSYVLGKINDEGAKQQLNNIVNRHQRFFNSTYC